MYLKKLEIFGFKSFQQKTNIDFDSGLTAIVGPNGCGKTNIVDALRWSLGEQRYTVLRSDKMENVIFNGTKNRKPMGMAEVSLTIENDKGILPTEYSEVTVTRRIFRSGESEYLLNKNLCRLKDITNLFMDTGMGSNAYSVIELKMVEVILSNKADERRTMFEEAAGVNKYKLRRRLTLKKLEDVKADLTRVNDIVAEVEKKVNSLERQAKRADKFIKLSNELKERELDLANRELALFDKNKSEVKIVKNELLAKKIKLESELEKLNDQLKEVKEKLYQIESKLAGKRTEINAQTEKIFKLEQNISIEEERKKSLDRNVERYKLEIEDLKNKLVLTQEEFHSNIKKSGEIFSSIEKKQTEKTVAQNTVQVKKDILEDKRDKLKEFSEVHLNYSKEIAAKENELSYLNKTLGNTNQNITKLNDKILTLTGLIAKTVGFIEELTLDNKDAQKKLAESEKEYTEKQKEKEKLEEKLARFKEKEIEEKGLVNALKDKVAFLRNLIDNLEGFSKGAKALLEDKNWTGKEKNLLANIGTAHDNYRFAIEAALKNNLNNVLVESIDDVKKGIQYLQDSDYGKAAFYVYRENYNEPKTFFDRVNDFFIKRSMKNLQTENGFIGWAGNLINTEVKWQPFFKKLLSRTVVIDNLDNAFKLSRKYSGFDFTTLNGDLIKHSGVIEGGSTPRIDDTLFGRKQLLENLEVEISQKEKNLLGLKDEIEALENQVSGIDLKVLSEKGRILLNDLSNVEKQIALFEFEKKKASDETEETRNEIKELVKNSNKLESEVKSFTAILDDFKEEKSKADAQKEFLEEEFKSVETEYNLAVSIQNKINLEFERLLGEKKNLENSINYSKSSIRNISESVSKRKIDIQTSSEESAVIEKNVSEKNVELTNYRIVNESLKKEEEEIERGYKEVRNRINEIEQSQNMLREEREEVAEQIHASEMTQKELDLKIENLIQNILENYSVTLELKQYDDLDLYDFKGKTDEVYALKQNIKNLGPVNSLAYSEYEEERSRFEFLTKQQNDLIESEKDLVKTIEEINITAQQLFDETFQKIRENFTNIFRGLFNPGDEADLLLEENTDPLEAKIEIIAKPKGKRPTTIELLSGGEKTLTAIALLFAIYLVKPSPFCILDEIDAPLDDANIDRFTKILKDFSTNTQFVVVTHNKRTMEACDTLYGVTMQEEGVSKLVSVKFNEELDFVP